MGIVVCLGHLYCLLIIDLFCCCTFLYGRAKPCIAPKGPWPPAIRGRHTHKYHWSHLLVTHKYHWSHLLVTYIVDAYLFYEVANL